MRGTVGAMLGTIVAMSARASLRVVDVVRPDARVRLDILSLPSGIFGIIGAASAVRVAALTLERITQGHFEPTGTGFAPCLFTLPT